MIASCGPRRELEPNGSHQQATPLRAGRRATGTISDPKDQDWYRLDTASEGTLAAKIGGIRDVDFVLVFLDKDRRELKRVDETSIGGDEQLLDLRISSDTHYLVVSNKNERSNNPSQAYELITRLEPAGGKEREPNDTALSAQPMEAGGTLRGHYWPKHGPLSENSGTGEEDWYSVEFAKEGLFLLNIDISEVPQVDPIVEIYDTNGYKLKEIDAGGVGEAENLRNFGARGPARFLLRLRSKHKTGGNHDVPYDLMTELLPYQGRTEFEPNDQRADATPFETDSIQGTIAPAGDADWYKVAIATEGRSLLRVELSGVPGMDLTLSLKDRLGNDLAVVDNAGLEQPEILTGQGATGGEHLLAVLDKSGKKAAGRDPYTLAKKLIPWTAGLEWEPNHSTATAQSLKIGESVDGYFAPKGDVDWYEFNVYQKGIVELELAGVLNVAPTIALFDQEFVELAKVSAKPGEPVVLRRELDRGTYAARLQPADAAQNNVRDKYSFRIRVK